MNDGNGANLVVHLGGIERREWGIAAVRRTSGTEGSRRQRPFADAGLIVPIDNLWESRVDTVWSA
jgi:hypothetical protein